MVGRALADGKVSLAAYDLFGYVVSVRTEQEEFPHEFFKVPGEYDVRGQFKHLRVDVGLKSA